MLKLTETGRLGRKVLVAGLALACGTFATAAFAGECPADAKKPNAREAVDMKPVGVTDTVIAMIDVEKEPAKIEDRKFRMRKLTIEPGGIVPWHSHGDRPAIIYIVEGEVVRICQQLRRADSPQSGRRRRRDARSFALVEEFGDKTVVLLSADLLKDDNDHNM